MSTSKHVISWRRRTKQRMVAAFGGICGKCKEEFPQEVFEFHHLNPDEKDFGLGSIRSNCISWERIVQELRKCIMLCANCHRLIEYGHSEVPENAQRFNESYLNYKKIEEKLKYDRCKCGKQKLKKQKYCSKECANSYSRKVEWPTKKELKSLLRNNSLNKVGQMYGVTHGAVKKWKGFYNL